MHVPHHIHGHIIPFTIAAVIVCCIGVLAHVYWEPAVPNVSVSPSPVVFELKDDAVVTAFC